MFIVGRDRKRGDAALAELARRGPGGHRFFAADLALLSDTARVSREILAASERIDALVCSAGILGILPEWTSEGLERNLVLNYLSRYLMVRALLPRLRQSLSGRVVLVSNAGMYPDTLDFDDLQHRKGKPGLAVASRTQFANDLLCTELAERLLHSTVQVRCVYPGMVKTAVFRNARGLPRWLAALLTVVQSVIGRSAAAAARTPAALALATEAHLPGARFYGPGLKAKRIPERALRAERRRGLWAASERLVQPHMELEDI